MNDVGRHQAEGAIDGRRIGNDHFLHVQLGAEHAGHDPARSAEGVQNEVARIEPALHRDFMDEIADLGGGDPVDAECGFLNGHAQGPGDLLVENAACVFRIETHRPAEEDIGIHVADEHEHVGQGGFGPTEAVANRARSRACRARPDPRYAGALLEPDDRAAAGADGHNLDFRLRIMKPIDHRLPRILDLAVLDDTDLEGGAAHIGRNHV